MGYACPVCETPQADATHLANHVAFTALVRGGDHESWLDECCPGWESDGEAELGERVVEYAEPVDFPVPDEDATAAPDTAPGEHDHGSDRVRHDARGRRPDAYASSDDVSSIDIDADADAGTGEALERARELTRRRRANRDAAMGDEDDAGDESGRES
jgi:hypothetical protein